MSILPHHMTC